MAFLYSNFAKATLSVAIDDTTTTLIVPLADQAGFPIIGGGSGDKFVLVAVDGRQAPEVMYAVDQGDGTFEVQRAREGSAAKYWPVGTALMQTVTAAVLNAFGGGDIDPAIIDAIYDAIEAVEVQAISAQASADAASASVSVEASARVAGDAANASLITTVDARVDDSFAAISNETTARVDAVAAVASDVTALTAVVGSNTAAITTESTARASADAALTSSLNALSATVTTNYGTLSANITAEATARANADVALSSRATTLEAQMANTAGSGLQSRIATEETARASADSTFASQITLLFSTTATTNANLTAEATTRANADTALATRATTLEAAVKAGPNLLRDPNFQLGLGTALSVHWPVTSGTWLRQNIQGLGSFAQTLVNGTNIITSAEYEIVAPGQVFSLQAEFRVPGLTTGGAAVDIDWTDSSGAHLSYSSQVLITPASYAAATKLPGGWVRVTTPDGIGITAPASAARAYVRAYAVGNNTDSGFRKIKLELGNTATLFSDDVTPNATEARIATEETTRASADSALASSISTVSATVAGHTASITSNATAIAQISGYTESQYSVNLNGGGGFVGFYLKSAGSGAPTGLVNEFRISAALVKIDGKYPFVFDTDTGTLKLQNIEVDGASIKNASVTNAAIQNLTLAGNKLVLGAVETERLYDYMPPADTPDTAFNWPLGDSHNYTTHNVTGGDLTAISVPQTFAGAECLIKCIMYFPNNVLTGAGVVELRYNGVMLQNWEIFMDRASFYQEVRHTPSAGSQTYTMVVRQNTGSGWTALKVGYRALKITEKIGGYQAIVSGSA